jgi:predicted nucleotidyltransferase
MTTDHKERLKAALARCLAQAGEVRKVVIFGSFLSSDSPNDMDVAVFVDEGQKYIPLAQKLRRLARPVSASIPLDIIPVRPNATGVLLDEIATGEVVYER